jgi:hypothetical protein
MDEQIQSFVTRQIDNAARDGFCLWKLVDKADARLVGFCGLQPLGTTGEVKIGWWRARLLGARAGNGGRAKRR